jgi:hypothetical protein
MSIVMSTFSEGSFLSAKFNMIKAKLHGSAHIPLEIIHIDNVKILLATDVVSRGIETSNNVY